MGQASDHDWTVGTQTTRFGFSGFRQSQDANGANLYKFSDVSARGVRWKRYANIHLGSFQFIAPCSIWITATLTGICFLIPCFAIMSDTFATEKAHARRAHVAFDSSAFVHRRLRFVYLRFSSAASRWQLSDFDVCDSGGAELLFPFSGACMGIGASRRSDLQAMRTFRQPLCL